MNINNNNSEQILFAIGEVSDDKILEADTNKLEQVTSKSVVMFWKVLAPIAACLVLVFAVFAIPELPLLSTTDPTKTTQPPANPDSYDLSNTSLIGLPVNNFCLSDIVTDAEACRMVFMKLHDFFRYDSPSFVFVRVLETEQWQSNFHGIPIDKQTSTVQILSQVWNSENTEIPQVIKIQQTVYGFGELSTTRPDDSTVLRKGGVYLLPIRHWEPDDDWYMSGDFDVLFEVDDKGLIWSHSPYRGFNQFDGKPSDTVVQAITDLTSCENFEIATTSSIAGVLPYDYELAQVTVLSVKPITSEWRSDTLYRYTLNSSLKGEFTVISWEEEKFDIGGEYLMFLCPTDETSDGIEIWSFYSTKINSDGTITGESGEEGSVFEDFAGHTPAQMAELAERAKDWRKKYKAD